MFVYVIAGLLKEPCTNDNQCSVDNSYCMSIGICGCLPGYRLFGSTQCIRRIEPMVSQKLKSIMTMTTTSKPVDTTTTEMSTTTTTREEERYVLPGEECSRRKKCIVGSVCIDGICRCPPGFMLEHNLCTRKKVYLLGEC